MLAYQIAHYAAKAGWRSPTWIAPLHDGERALVRISACAPTAFTAMGIVLRQWR